MSTWRIYPILSRSTAVLDVPLCCMRIRSRNNADPNDYMIPNIKTAPSSPTGTAQVYSGTNLLGIVPRGNYIYFADFYDGIHRYNLSTTEDDVVSYGVDSQYDYSFAVLDDDNIITQVGLSGGIYKRFEKHNLSTGVRTAITSNISTGLASWHWRILGNKLVYMLIHDNPAGGERSHDFYVYDITGSNQLFSSIGAVEGADAYLQYQVTQSVIVGNDVFFEYHSGLSDYNSYEETSHLLKININTYGISVSRPEHNGNNVYIEQLTYNPSDGYLYFIALSWESSKNTFSLGKMTTSFANLTWLLSEQLTIPPGDMSLLPLTLIPSSSQVYLVKGSGNVYNVSSLGSVLTTLPFTLYSYDIDHPQPNNISNIVDDNNRLWYIDSGDVKAVDLTDGSIVVNINSDLPTPGGAYGCRHIYISNEKMFVLIDNTTGTDYIYEVA